MKLVALLMLIAAPALADFSNAASLRTQIASLYAASREPYAPTPLVSSSTEASRFAGCVSVEDDGTITKDDKLVAVRYAYEVEHDYGPLHPAKRKTLDVWAWSKVIKEDVASKDSKFDGGDFLFINAGKNKTSYCETLASNKQFFNDSSAGLNAAGDTYELIERCAAKEISRVGYRKSGNYLVVKWVTPGEKNKPVASYGYCWK